MSAIPSEVSKATLPSYDMFTSLPQVAERVIEARVKKNTQTCEAYRYLLCEFERASGHSMQDSLEKLSRIDPNERLNPSIHAVTYRAKEAMTNGDALGCYRSLKWIDNAVGNLDHSGLLVQPPDNSPASFEAISHILKDATEDVHGRRAEIYATSENDITPFRAEFKEALRLLKVADEQIYDETISLVSHATIFNAKAIMGGSLNRTFGAIFIASPDSDPIGPHESYLKHRGVPYFLEHLVHESSHNLLFALMIMDPMVLNPVSQKFSAPLRKDLRPMYGIYHAVFVVARMVRVFKLLVNKGYPEYQKMVDHFEPRLKNGIKVVSEHGDLTIPGKKFFETFPECGML
jgi:hypothetical protein